MKWRKFLRMLDLAPLAALAAKYWTKSDPKVIGWDGNF